MTYNEDRIWRKKRYELGDDQILLRIRNLLGSQFELAFPLTDLSPVFDRLLLREGSKIVFISLLVLIVLLLLMWPAFYHQVSDMRIIWGSIIALILVFAGLAACWLRTQYILFKWKTGVGALAIGRRGSEKLQFDQFVAALTEAIQNRSEPGNRK